MKRAEQREWLMRLAFEQQFNQPDCSIEQILIDHELPQSNLFLANSLRSLKLHQDEIDQLLAGYLHSWSLDRILPIDRAILRIAVNEMIYTGLAPVPVTISESVELSKKYSDKESYRFINGVLGSISRDIDAGKIKSGTSAAAMNEQEDLR